MKKIMTNKFFKQAALAVAVLLASTGSVWAATAGFQPLINRVLESDPDKYGGCMARTSINPRGILILAKRHAAAHP